MVRAGDSGQRGAAAVEFAIVLPLLAVVLFGIVEFSLIMYDKTVITSASRVGARYGSLFTTTRPTCDQIRTAVQAFERDLFVWAGTPRTIAVNCYQLDAANNPTAGVCPSAANAGERLAVEAVFAYGSHQLVNMLTGPVTLRSTTVMNCE